MRRCLLSYEYLCIPEEEGVSNFFTSYQNVSLAFSTHPRSMTNECKWLFYSGSSSLRSWLIKCIIYTQRERAVFLKCVQPKSKKTCSLRAVIINVILSAVKTFLRRRKLQNQFPLILWWLEFWNNAKILHFLQKEKKEGSHGEKNKFFPTSLR